MNPETSLYVSFNSNGMAAIQAYFTQKYAKKTLISSRFLLFVFENCAGICPLSLNDLHSIPELQLNVLLQENKDMIKEVVVLGEEMGMIKDFTKATKIEGKYLECNENMNLKECKKCAKIAFSDIDVMSLTSKYEFLKGFVESMYV